MSNFLDGYNIPKQPKKPAYLEPLKWGFRAFSFGMVLYIISLTHAKISVIVCALYLIYCLFYFMLKLKK